MASRLRPAAAAAAFLRCAAAGRNPAVSRARSLALVLRASSSVGRLRGLARSLQPLQSTLSEARLTSRLGAEAARAVSQGTLCSSFPGV